MYPIIGDVERPNANDQQTLRTKYATPLPPGCAATDPFTPVVELGTLTQTTLRLGECLDLNRPNRIFNFQLAAARKIKLSLIADESEINVEVISGNTGYWQSVNTGMKDKSKIVDFPAGRYFMRVWFQTIGSHYRLLWDFQ
jgi:hypothetical protein